MTTVYPYDYERDEVQPYFPLKRNARRNGLRNTELDAIRRNLTDPWHLVALAQAHQPPRLSERQYIMQARALTRGRPVADALFPLTRQRLILAFFMAPTASYQQSRLLACCNIGRGAGQRELMNLMAAGLIERIRGARMNECYYRANLSSPLLPVMRKLAEGMLFCPWWPMNSRARRRDNDEQEALYMPWEDGVDSD